MARHRRAPPTKNGIIIGRRAIAETFGISTRTLDRWIRERGFPAAHLPNGMLATSTSLIDAWMLKRLRNDAAERRDVLGSYGRDGRKASDTPARAEVAADEIIPRGNDVD